VGSDTYGWLAKYFDYLFEFRRPYESARKTILEPLLPRVGSACDLCCGTGALALQFAAAGISTFAVDLSPEMCRIARTKARASELPVRVLHADMREFTLPAQVDLITCEFDSLNHVPQRRDLDRVLRRVSAALKPGGHFIFDVNNRLAFERVWRLTWFTEKDPVVMVMHGGHKPGTDRAWSDVEWFVRVGKCWKRHHEHIEEVCWTAGEIRDALAARGFAGVRSWDAEPFFNDQFTRPGYRTFWRARRT
jgi:SAM-dependent methyltransferase